MDIDLLITPQMALFGASWYPRDEALPYSEFNLYFLCFKLSFYWDVDEDYDFGDDDYYGTI